MNAYNRLTRTPGVGTQTPTNKRVLQVLSRLYIVYYFNNEFRSVLQKPLKFDHEVLFTR